MLEVSVHVIGLVAADSNVWAVIIDLVLLVAKVDMTSAVILASLSPVLFNMNAVLPQCSRA